MTQFKKDYLKMIKKELKKQLQWGTITKEQYKYLLTINTIEINRG